MTIFSIYNDNLQIIINFNIILAKRSLVLLMHLKHA